MCYGRHHQRPFSKDHFAAAAADPQNADAAAAAEDLRSRLAETEARLARARAREAELSRRLEEMKRFVSVMEILETYLARRFSEQRDRVERRLGPSPRS
ncbi:protein SKIP34 [Rhodamnia argentea]|uniref:Protein SKIP34 n=1 Tax=Rhodamnia argentea TaxID=178133 RepID=A0A8B8P1B4_9MYRT|nr:protein SKIP34 [Rhodamnia argentea]